MARTFSKVFIVLDALDEGQFSTVKDVLKGLFRLQEACKINIFATSRNIPEISTEFNNPKRSSLSMEIQANEEDVLKYLDGQMSRIPGFGQRNKSLQDQISKTIASSVEGM